MKKLLIASILLSLLASCKDDIIYKVDTVQIEQIQMSDTVLLNEIAQINVKAFATNGCWSDLFVTLEKEEAFTYSIKAFGTFSCREGGCACADVMVSRDTIIDFQPNQKGTYIFEILKNYSEHKTINDTLTVQ